MKIEISYEISDSVDVKEMPPGKTLSGRCVVPGTPFMGKQAFFSSFYCITHLVSFLKQ